MKNPVSYMAGFFYIDWLKLLFSTVSIEGKFLLEE